MNIVFYSVKLETNNWDHKIILEESTPAGHFQECGSKDSSRRRVSIHLSSVFFSYFIFEVW